MENIPTLAPDLMYLVLAFNVLFTSDCPISVLNAQIHTHIYNTNCLSMGDYENTQKRQV